MSEARKVIELAAATDKQIFNDFEHVRQRKEDSQLGYFLKAKCSSCSNTESIEIPRGYHTLDQPLAEDLFKRRGWHIGRRRKFDVCTTCVRIERDRRNAARNERQQSKLAEVFPPELKAMAAEASVTPTAAPKVEPQPKAEAPGTMSREDRRLIWATLHEHYIDEKVGYDNGWSDKKVADDLGVPIAWVSQIRDDNFGPERSNEEVRQLCQEVKNQLVAVRNEIERINIFATDIIKYRDVLRKFDADWTKRLEQFEKLFK